MLEKQKVFKLVNIKESSGTTEAKLQDTFWQITKLATRGLSYTSFSILAKPSHNMKPAGFL